MSDMNESEPLPPGECLTSQNNKHTTVQGHYINTSAIFVRETSPANYDRNDRQISANNSKVRDSISIYTDVDPTSDECDPEKTGAVTDDKNNTYLLDTNTAEAIKDDAGRSTSAIVGSREDNTTAMDNRAASHKPKHTRKYLQRKRLKLLVNKVVEKFKENVKNQRAIRLHMNVKPKQAWDYGPLTTGAYNEIRNVIYNIPVTTMAEWTIEGQINTDNPVEEIREKRESVTTFGENSDGLDSSGRNQEVRFPSPSTDAVTVLADAYILDSDIEDANSDLEEDGLADTSHVVASVNVTAPASTVTKDTSATAETSVIGNVATATLSGTVPVSAIPTSTSDAEVPPTTVSKSETAATNVVLTSAANDKPLHLVTISTNVSSPPKKSLVKPTVKPVQRSAPILNEKKAITFVSSTFDKSRQNVTFAKSATSIPLSVIKPIHSAPVSGSETNFVSSLQREDTLGSRAPLPSLASHDSMHNDDDNSETSSSSPQNKTKLVVTLPDISTDVEEHKKVQHTKIVQNNFSSANSNRALNRIRQKSPPNRTLESSVRITSKKPNELPTIKPVISNEEPITSLKLAPANTTKESTENIPSDVSGSSSDESPEVIESALHASPLVASIPKLHKEDSFLSIKGTNVSHNYQTGDNQTDNLQSESLELPKNMLGNRLSIVIVNRKRAKACRQRHKRKSAHESEPDLRDNRNRSSYRRQKSMEYTGPFIERFKTEFPSLTNGKVWNPDMDTSKKASPENLKDLKKKTVRITSMPNPADVRVSATRGTSEKDVQPLGTLPQSYKLNGQMSDFLYRVFVRQNLNSQNGKKPTQPPLPEVTQSYKPFRSLTFVQDKPAVPLYRQPNLSSASSVKLGIVNNPSFLVLR